MCGEAELRDGSAFRARGQSEEPFRLVVGEQQVAVPAGDEHAFLHGVQDRVMVLVHARELGGVQAVGLAPHSLAHEDRTCRHDE